jgi:hypothetical protein
MHYSTFPIYSSNIIGYMIHKTKTSPLPVTVSRKMKSATNYRWNKI